MTSSHTKTLRSAFTISRGDTYPVCHPPLHPSKVLTTAFFVRNTFLILALAGTQVVVPVRAAVNMISVDHRVWGNAGTTTYDVTSAEPLSRNVSAREVNPYSHRWEYGNASSSASDWSVSSYRYGDANFAYSRSQNTYIFKPLSRELSISLSGSIGVWWFENQANMSLTDMVTNTLVSNYFSPSYTRINPFPQGTNDMRDFSFTYNDTVMVNPEHEYKLTIYTAARRGEGGDGSASLYLAPLPEPTATLLTGMTLLLMCGRRRRSV